MSEDKRQMLLERLRSMRWEDPETGHLTADELLLEYIGDPEVTAAFHEIDKWYA